MNMRMCRVCGDSCGIGEAFCPSCGAPGLHDEEAAAPPVMRFGIAAVVALTGAVAMGFGSFLPWVQATVPSIGTTITQSGVAAGDGVVTLAFAGAVATFGFVLARGTAERWIGPALVAVGAAVSLLVGVGFTDLSNRFEDAHKVLGAQVITDYGIGL